ncbi:MAG: hypothetical protein V1679_02540 [Candidatus Peregrinibacteria bacterium]
MNNITELEEKQKAIFRDNKAQKKINTPLSDPNGVSGENKAFLSLVVKLIDKGKIDLYAPSSIINDGVYGKLNEQMQGKTDLEATNLLSALRDIKDLYDAGMKDTFQMNNLLERVRETKERLEEIKGDVFII